MTLTPARIVSGLVAALLLPGVLWGMEPKFELDLRALDSRPAARADSSAAKSPAENSPKKSIISRKAGRRAVMGTQPKSGSTPKKYKASAATAERYGLQLLGSVRKSDAEGLDAIAQIWDELLPGKEATPHEVDLETGQFVLSLDPERYPVYSAADGGHILVDRHRSMPPLVKSLLMQNEPHIRVVNENPADTTRFVRAVLNSAGFYSLEENFDFGFGDDPKLLVHADYKIERDAESLLENEMILLNVEPHRSRMPQSLVTFLNNRGFQVIDSTLPRNGVKVEGLGTVCQIFAEEPEKIADSLMDALEIRFERDRNLDMAGFSEHGIRLKIRADRYFEAKGKNFVVSLFNGDPVTYTLIRLMETSGYRVIILDERDDLKTVAEKFNSRLQLNGQYGTHKLLDSRDLPYGIEMSGMMMHDSNGRKSVVVTNRPMEPLTRELAELNGYSVRTY